MTASTGRMACTQDGNSTGESASSPLAGGIVACDEGDSVVSGSGRESQSGISIEKRESTSWFESDEGSPGVEKILENRVGSGVPAGGTVFSSLGSSARLNQSMDTSPGAGI